MTANRVRTWNECRHAISGSVSARISKGCGAAGAGLVAASVGGAAGAAPAAVAAPSPLSPGRYAHGSGGAPASSVHFGRIFPSLPPFADATDTVRAALLEVGQQSVRNRSGQPDDDGEVHVRGAVHRSRHHVRSDLAARDAAEPVDLAEYTHPRAPPISQVTDAVMDDAREVTRLALHRAALADLHHERAGAGPEVPVVTERPASGEEHVAQGSRVEALLFSRRGYGSTRGTAGPG
jgi:hypothetical protein